MIVVVRHDVPLTQLKIPRFVLKLNRIPIFSQKCYKNTTLQESITGSA